LTGINHALGKVCLVKKGLGDGDTDLPILSMLRTPCTAPARARRKHRPRRYAPYHARDLAPPNFASALQRASVTMARTDPGHIGAAGGSVQFDDDRNVRYETRPRGTAASLSISFSQPTCIIL
jgi:hypothetical protein